MTIALADKMHLYQAKACYFQTKYPARVLFCPSLGLRQYIYGNAKLTNQRFNKPCAWLDMFTLLIHYAAPLQDYCDTLSVFLNRAKTVILYIHICNIIITNNVQCSKIVFHMKLFYYKVAHWPSGESMLLPLPVGAGVLSLHESVMMLLLLISTPPVFLFTLASVIVF